MAPRQYMLVMRHAERQDEVEEGWATKEAMRPGGRPWDPPLSSPRGLAQADEAAARLAAWEQQNGARIVAVVVSPFLRCLQTAASVCRRLGLPRLHLSWSASETLCRVHQPPPGPLPAWMWPRLQQQQQQQQQQQAEGGGQEGGGGDGGWGLSPEEYLVTLGAAVEAAAGAGEGQERQRQAEPQAQEELGGGARGAGACALPEEQATGEANGLGMFMQGLSVAVLPPPQEPRASPRAPAGPQPHPGHTGAQHDGGHDAEVAEAEAEAAAGGPGMGEGEDAAGRRGGAPGKPGSEVGPGAGVASSVGASGGERVSGSAAAGLADVEADPPGSGSGSGSGGAGPVASEARLGAAAGAREGHEAHLYGGGDNGAADGTLVSDTADMVYCDAPYSTPCSPETLEAAHARYQALLRCIMAAAPPLKGVAGAGPGAGAAAAAGPSRGASSDGGGGGPGHGGGGYAGAERAGGAAVPLVVGGVGGPGMAAWRALWLADDRRSDVQCLVGGAAAAPGPGAGHAGCEAAGAGSSEARGDAAAAAVVDVAASGDGSPPPLDGTEGRQQQQQQRAAAAVAAAAAAVAAAQAEAEAADRTPLDSLGDDLVRHYARQPISQLDSVRARGAGGGAPAGAEEAPGGGGGGADGPALAVLVLSHGEAVACAATTVAPWALVYEVRHTGFIALATAADGGDESGEAAAAPGGGVGASVDAAWELLADPTHGERGVLWMSALDD